MPTTATPKARQETMAERYAIELAVLSELHGIVRQSEPLLENAYKAIIAVQHLTPRLARLVDECEPPKDDDDNCERVFVNEDEWKALVELRDTFADLDKDYTEIYLHRAWRAAYHANGQLDDTTGGLIEEIRREADPAACGASDG